MSLAPPQSLALALLRGRRSPRSWIAGSTVLHPYLARHPGDLDIHHPDARAARAAIRMDLSVLLEHGFAIDGSAWQETERWARFRHDTGSVVLNWVVIAHPDRARPRRHPDFGYAVPVEDAVAEKLGTAQSSGRPKDIEDLRAIRRAAVPLPTDLGRRVEAFLRRPLSASRAGPGRGRR
ncbi:hypothetical protein FFK22_028535 [Mycobacterium sp. KBS0706]|uniref:hypothetical protein n=1 Tax=Mycobacterium sp. KBS0706 TaxID=2578109 RepID=UPI00110F996E|nr:hypothetical protein [Mycobacterium sp. KBS0706]TSD85262.1 hypothetical protein FFK22_028535 [Mycobacterium sp. KBS0706]